MAELVGGELKPGTIVEFICDYHRPIKGMAEHTEGMKVTEGMKGTVLKRQDMRLLIQGIDFDFRINVPEVAVFAITAGETEAGNASPGKQKSKKPKGTKEGWKDIHKIIFVSLLRSMRQTAAPVHVSVTNVIGEAIGQFPSLFSSKLKRQTANRWEAYVEKLEREEREQIARNLSAATLAAEKEKATLAAGEKEPVVVGQKRKSKNRETISAEDKKTEWEEKFKHQSNRAVLPTELLVGLAVMLWTMSQSGVPMTCAIALPLILGHMMESGYENLIHPQQVYYPLNTSMADEGIKPHKGTTFWTKRVVNRFCCRIGLTMRKGTKSFAKQRNEEQITACRHIMYLRLLFMVLTFSIPEYLVYNFDETGVELLRFGEYGRAQCGLAEVSWHGFDDKRQFTACIVINALGEMVQPTQIIWRGKADLYGACPKGNQNDPDYLRKLIQDSLLSLL